MVGAPVEVYEGQQDHIMKVLVLKEMYSSSVGAIVMTDNISNDRANLLWWLSEFGLEPTESSVVLLTDAEEAVKSFVMGCTDKHNFLIRRASPQGHESVGGVERGNRLIREQLAALQSEYQGLGSSLVFRRDILQFLLNFICMSHNSHGKAHSGDRAPREIVSGRKLPQQEFPFFGSKVHVEVPEPIRKLCPNMTRFIDGTFLHFQFNPLGSVV